MLRRVGRAPLYEYMNRDDARTGAAPRAARSIGPGGGGVRSLRVPVGYVFLAAAVGLLSIVGAYAWGYRSANKALRAEWEDRMLARGDRFDPEQMAVIQDPVARPTEAIGGGSIGLSNSDSAGGAAAPPRPEPGSWGPVRSDPRVDGWHYLVVAATREEGGLRLAAFLRERGLEAYVATGHNARLATVFLLPGHPDPKDPAVADLKPRVIQAGKEWAASRPGERNLSDCYVAKH